MEIAVKLKENRRYPDNALVRYQAGKRWIIGWSEMKVSWEESSSAEAAIPWKDGGIYLITGGAGGLGLILPGKLPVKPGMRSRS